MPKNYICNPDYNAARLDSDKAYKKSQKIIDKWIPISKEDPLL